METPRSPEQKPHGILLELQNFLISRAKAEYEKQATSGNWEGQDAIYFKIPTDTSVISVKTYHTFSHRLFSSHYHMQGTLPLFHHNRILRDANLSGADPDFHYNLMVDGLRPILAISIAHEAQDTHALLFTPEDLDPQQFLGVQLLPLVEANNLDSSQPVLALLSNDGFEVIQNDYEAKSFTETLRLVI